MTMDNEKRGKLQWMLTESKRVKKNLEKSNSGVGIAEHTLRQRPRPTRIDAQTWGEARWWNRRVQGKQRLQATELTAHPPERKNTKRNEIQLGPRKEIALPLKGTKGTCLAVTGERVLRRKDDGRSFEEGLVMVDLIMENAGSETDL